MILNRLFGGRHHFAPLKDPKMIMDIGTGTGQWAIDMGTLCTGPCLDQKC